MIQGLAGQGLILKRHKKIYATNEAFVVGDLTLIVKNVRKQTTVGYGTVARTGAKFIVFDVDVKNTGKKSTSFISGDITAVDSQEREYDVAGGNKDKTGRYLDSKIQPGLSTQFVEFYVEVPQQVNALRLKVVDNYIWASDTKYVDISV